MAVEPLPSTLLDDRMRDWWRPFALDLDGRILAQRRRGIVVLRQALAPDNLVDAVAYAHGDESRGKRIIELVRRAIRVSDPGYDGRVGDAEPPALVAAALADQLVVDPDGDISTLLSLLVLGAAYGGHRPVIAGIALADYAAFQLEHRSLTVRGSAAPSSSASALVSGWGSLADVERRGAYHEVLAALAGRIDELAANLQYDNAVLRERLDLLSWIAAAWCETADAPWRDVDATARPLIAGVELADRTRGITPAPDATAFLGSVLNAANPGFGVDPIAAVVAGAPYLEGRLGAAPHPFPFPFATALERWRTRGEDGFAALAGIDLGSGWQDDVTIALQVYREVLALRGLGNE